MLYVYVIYICYMCAVSCKYCMVLDADARWLFVNRKSVYPITIVSTWNIFYIFAYTLLFARAFVLINSLNKSTFRKSLSSIVNTLSLYNIIMLLCLYIYCSHILITLTVFHLVAPNSWYITLSNFKSQIEIFRQPNEQNSRIKSESCVVRYTLKT